MSAQTDSFDGWQMQGSSLLYLSRFRGHPYSSISAPYCPDSGMTMLYYLSSCHQFPSFKASLCWQGYLSAFLVHGSIQDYVYRVFRRFRHICQIVRNKLLQRNCYKQNSGRVFQRPKHRNTSLIKNNFRAEHS